MLFIIITRYIFLILKKLEPRDWLTLVRIHILFYLYLYLYLDFLIPQTLGQSEEVWNLIQDITPSDHTNGQELIPAYFSKVYKANTL